MRASLSLTLGLIAVCLTLGCQPQAEAKRPKKVHAEFSSVETKVGTGPEAAEGDLVFVEYRGQLADGGKQFDTNIDSATNKNPFSFVIGAQQAVDGLDRGVRGMRVGGERLLKVPESLGYGAAGSPPSIPPYSDLEFEVRLLGIVKKGEETVYDIEDVKAGAGRQVQKGDRIEVHYQAVLLNGRVVDDSRKRGQTVVFRVGANEAITSVDQGVVGMRVGGQRKLTLPPGAAWGEFGTPGIPPQQTVIYTVELIGFK